jgi:hypothetical protein
MLPCQARSSLFEDRFTRVPSPPVFGPSFPCQCRAGSYPNPFTNRYAKCIVARLSDLPFTPQDREALSAELARIERGPTAADSKRPGVLASVLIAFAIPGVIAITAALIASLFKADTLGPLFWTWGVLSALGVLLLIAVPRRLGALLTRFEIRFFMPEEAPGGKRSQDLRSALAAGTFRRAEFTTTAAVHPRIIDVGDIDDEGPTCLMELGPGHWLLLRGSEFEALLAISTDEDKDLVYRIPELLCIDWIPATGQFLRLVQNPPVHELTTTEFINATNDALAGTQPSDFTREVTELHADL